MTDGPEPPSVKASAETDGGKKKKRKKNRDETESSVPRQVENDKAAEG